MEKLEYFYYEEGEELIKWLKERIEMSEFIEASEYIAKYNENKEYPRGEK